MNSDIVQSRKKMINNKLSSFFIRKSVIFHCGCISLTPEKKKQVESAVRDSASNESKNGTSHDGIRCTVLKLSGMLEQVLNLQPK